jgi:hypothetical protein
VLLLGGEEVRHEFESQFVYAEELFSEVYDSDPVREKYPLLFLTARAPGHSNIGPQIHLDLWEANRRQLLDAGLKAKRITVVGECTACARVGGQLKYFPIAFAGRADSACGKMDDRRVWWARHEAPTYWGWDCWRGRRRTCSTGAGC